MASLFKFVGSVLDQADAVAAGGFKTGQRTSRDDDLASTSTRVSRNVPDSDLNSTAPQSSSLESRPADQRSSVHGDAASSVTSDAMVVDNLGEAVTSASDALGRNESDRTASHEPYLYTGSTSTPGPGVRLPVSALPSAAGSNSTLTSSASANTSSVLVDDSDVTGLRLAWQQTREDLERTRGVARDMKHKFESKRAELIAAHRIEIQELKDRHHAEIAEVKSLLLQNQREFDTALRSKDAFRSSLERQLQEQHVQMRALEADSERLTERIRSLESEQARAVSQQGSDVEQQASMLKRLRDEYEQRERALEEQRKMHVDTLQSVQHRESELEQNNEQYSKALADAYKAVEERDRQLQQVISQQRWAEADQVTLRNQVAQLKLRLETEAKQHAAAIDQEREVSASLTRRLDSLTVENQEAHRSVEQHQARIQELELKQSMQASTTHTLRISELESGLRTMTDHVLQKQNTIERLSSERSSLRVQLDNELQRVKTLEARLQQLTTERASQRLDASDDEDDFEILDLESGSSSSTSLRVRPAGAASGVEPSRGAARKSQMSRKPSKFDASMHVTASSSTAVKAMASAVGFIDHAGVMLGSALRRQPAVRLIFGTYLVVLHLWVLFVLYHFVHHAADASISSDPSFPTGSG